MTVSSPFTTESSSRRNRSSDRVDRGHGRSMAGLIGLRRLRPLAVVTLMFVGFQALGPWNYAQAAQLERLSSERLESQRRVSERLGTERGLAAVRAARNRAGTAQAGATERGGRAAVPVEMAAPPARATAAVDGALQGLEELRAGLGDLDSSLAPPSLKSRAQELRDAADALELRLSPLDEVDREAIARFEHVGERVEAAGLPSVILQRHRSALREHRERYRAVRQEIERTVRLARELARIAGRGGRSTEIAPRRQELLESVGASERRLAEMVETPEPPEMDMDRLPHRVSQLEPGEPRLDPADFTEIGAPPVGSAAAASRETAEVVGLAARATLPGPADLAQTPEVRFTPEILLQAAELGDDPRAIFNFVRNSVEPTPTWGSIQGADACLQTLRCNAFDTASLLIALLRVSGIPARYALGTVEVPIEELQRALGGFSDPHAAVRFMASSGTPVVGVGSGGELAAARFEHVWVEAFVDYVPSRGVVNEEGDTWVPLDPFFKQVEMRFGIDPLEAVGFDAQGFLSDLIDRAVFDETLGVVEELDLEAVDLQLAALEDDIAAAVEDPATPDTPLGLLGGLEIVERELELFPGALPYDVLVRAGPLAEVPSELRHRLRFEVFGSFFAINPELAHEASLPELAGHRVSLSYAPATAADEETLLALLPQDESDLPVELPGYLIDMRPELRVDGELLATGAATALGSTGRFRMRFSGPRGSARTVTNNVIAGSYNVIVLNLGQTSGLETATTRMEATLAQLESGDLDGLTKGDLAGDLLYAGGLAYWTTVDVGRRLAASRTGVREARLPSEGIFSHVPRVELLFGAPSTVSGGALFTDVDASVSAVQGLDGDREQAVSFMLISGMITSRAESATWDALVNETPTGAGITSMSYLEEAIRRGIPVFAVDRDNLDTVLPLLEISGSVERTVRNGVNAGRIVVIPQRQFEKDGFRGIGFVVLDPETGAAAYQISSALAGGALDFEIKVGELRIDGGELLLSMTLTVGGSLLPALLGFTLALFTLQVGLLVAMFKYLKKLQQNPDLAPECRAILFLELLHEALLAVGFSEISNAAKLGVVFDLILDFGGALAGEFVESHYGESFDACTSGGGGGSSGGGTGGDGGSGDGGSGDGGTGDGGTSDGGTSDGGTDDGGTSDGGTGDGGGSDGGTDDGGTGDGGTDGGDSGGDGGGDGTGDGGTDGGGTGDGGTTGDLPAGVSVDDVVVTEGAEPMLQAVFTVTLSRPLAESLTLDFTTADGTATAGDDYQARSGTVTLLAGETSRQIAVNVLDDVQVEGDETFSVLLTLPAGTTLDVEITDGEGVGTIQDDDGSSVVGAANDNEARYRNRDAPRVLEHRTAELREAA